MINPGIYPDLSSDDYHNDKQSLSRSSLKDFARNPYYYWAMHLNPERPARKQTDEMIFGTAFHTYILEKNLFNEQFAIEPMKRYLKYDGETLYRAYKQECEALERSEKYILSNDDFLQLVQMEGALLRDPRTMQLIKGAEIEKSFFWNDAESGLTIKARPDILHTNMIVDLKTCANASPEAFQRAIVDGSFHWQAAMIRDAVRILEGRDIPNVIFINVEKKYPFNVGIYCLDEAAIDIGQQEYKQILLDLKHAIVHNSFPDYEIETIGLPGWYK